MQRVRYLLWLTSLTFAAQAQPIPVEFFGGNTAFTTQVIFGKRLTDSRFGVFSLLTYNLPYDREDRLFAYYTLQAAATYNLTRHVRVFGGTYLKNIDYGPSAGAQFILPGRRWFLILHNGNDLSRVLRSQFMVLAEYRPTLKGSLQLYSRVQVMQETDYQTRTRGFQQLRLGLGGRGVQGGIGINVEQFGPLPFTRENMGLFVRAEL
jgi:hypothetical protein